MNFLRCLFSIACFSATFGMTIFWCYKFWIDEDYCQVDYKTFESSLDVETPMLSFCLIDPFIESELKKYNESFSFESYKKFLKGLEFHNEMVNISFHDVTLDLASYYVGHNIVFWNGTIDERIYPNLTQEEPKLTYVGQTFDGFYKCYGINFNFKNAKCGYLYFQSNEISHLTNRNYATFLHLPNQLLLSSDSLKYTWPKRFEKQEFSMDFTISQIEIFKRRSKRKKFCIPTSIPYDAMMINNQIKRNGCIAPYQDNPDDLPVCRSKEEMAKASLDPLLTIEHISPCKSARNIIYSYDEKNYETLDNNEEEFFLIGLCFPNEFKEISQHMAVDIQTVIGNAGGYVGLFLGKQIVEMNNLETRFVPIIW